MSDERNTGANIDLHVPVLPRVDMRPLADRLTADETGDVRWDGGDPGDLSPELGHDGESTIDVDTLVRRVADQLSATA